MGIQFDVREKRHSATDTWLHLIRVVHKLERLAGESLREPGLSLAQFDVLSQVGANEGMTQQELADSLLVTKGNVCQLLDRMAGTGLIERRQQGRSNCLYLTDRGREVLEDVLPRHHMLIERIFAGLPEDDQDRLLELLDELESGLPLPGSCDC